MQRYTLFTIGVVLVGLLHTAGSAYAQPTDECTRYPVLFADDLYRGRTLELDSDVADLHRLGFGDAASAVCVPSGWRVVVYEDTGFRGDGLELAGPAWVADLRRDRPQGQDWGDRISSVKVFRTLARGRPGSRFDPQDELCAGAPVLYMDAGFRGRSMRLPESVADLHDSNMGDEASSVCVPHGWTVVLYQDTNFRGDALELRGPDAIDDLKRDQPHGEDWGDRISSVRVVSSGRRGIRRDRDAPRECDRYPMLFADDDLGGESLQVDESIGDLHRRGFGDRASSVCIPRGWRLILYEDHGFQGDRLDLVGPRIVFDLKRDRPRGDDWGDRISSVRVSRQ